MTEVKNTGNDNELNLDDVALAWGYERIQHATFQANFRSLQEVNKKVTDMYNEAMAQNELLTKRIKSMEDKTKEKP